MEKKFFNFSDGKKLSDAQINDMLRELVRYFEQSYPSFAMSTGDTKVSFHRWNTQTEFIVANSSGYSQMIFYVDEYHALPDFDFNYRRPVVRDM